MSPLPKHLRWGSTYVSKPLRFSFLWPDQPEQSALVQESIRASRWHGDLLRIAPWVIITMGDLYVAYRAGMALRPNLYFALLAAQVLIFPGLMGLLAAAATDSQFETFRRRIGIDNMALTTMKPDEYAHGILFRASSLHSLGNFVATIAWMIGGAMICILLAIGFPNSLIGMRLTIFSFCCIIGGLLRFFLLQASIAGGAAAGMRASLMIRRPQRTLRLITDWLLTWAFVPALLLISLSTLYLIFFFLLPILIVPPTAVAIVILILLPRMIVNHAVEVGMWTLRESDKWWIRNPEDPDWVPYRPPRWWEPFTLLVSGLLHIRRR
ncbi:hypothetical protein KQI84_03245 [bacterium]|nr:hypothetical protein [bacterium]